MARRHDLVGDELVGRRAPEVTVEATRGAGLRLVERHHAPADVRRVGCPQGVVAGDPAPRPAVAGFAADAVGNLKARAALSWRGRIGMASEAGACPLRRTEPEFRRDSLAPGLGQRAPGAAMDSRLAMRVLPSDQFVLTDGQAARGRSAMTGGAATGGDAFMDADPPAGRRLGVGRRYPDPRHDQEASEHRGHQAHHPGCASPPHWRSKDSPGGNLRPPPTA